MGKVVFAISMALDGLSTGSHDSPEQPLSEGGERLYAWVFEGNTENDTRVCDDVRT